jgi:NAD(P)-dependent dehydrogenase (short-subunit alcohol dehydrogenase family)
VSGPPASGDPTPTKRTVVVTGAGRGLGAEIARAAATAGWTVGVLDRDEVAASATVDAMGAGAVVLVADTTDERAVEAALDRFADATGRAAPDSLVCNAGIVRFGPLLDLSVDDWRSVVEVNLTGTFVTGRAVARRMVAAEQGGSIVTVTSMNGVVPGPNAGAYAATKAGIARLTQQMALEWGSRGIRVNAVAPGLIDGGMSAPIYADADVRSRREGAVPLGRLGTGPDVAAAVLFLLSGESAYVTGTELLVDGGVTMSVIAGLPRPRSVDSVGLGEEGA